jgi:hypothetical protein
MESNPKLDLDNLRKEAVIACDTYYNFSVEGIQKLIKNRASDLDGIAPLANFVSDRVSTSLLLLKLGKLWDAEIIFRTVLEVFAKFLIIIRTKSEEELKTKLDEFWIHLNEIEKLRQSQEAAKIIEAGNIRNPERFQYMILSDEERIKLEKIYPNQTRKVMRENWSFNKIYLSLIKDESIEMFVPIELIHFFWKMSSHLAHGDKIGVNTVILRGKLTELKIHNDLTQLMKLAKTATMINIWVYAELASFLAETIDVHNACNMHDELGEFMTSRHQLVLNEAYILEDEFARKQQ